MPRIACLMVGLAATALAAVDASAAATIDHRRASSSAPRHQHSLSNVTANPVRAPVVQTVIVGHAPAYRSAYSSQQRQGLARSPTSGVYYVPASSPDAPPFSFNGSGEMQGWHWQRVSLVQLDAEVRARRAAKGLSQSAEVMR